MHNTRNMHLHYNNKNILVNKMKTKMKIAGLHLWTRIFGRKKNKNNKIKILPSKTN